MPEGKHQTSGEEHQDVSASLMSLARLLARQAAAELSAAASAQDAPSSPVSTEEEVPRVPNKN